MMLELEDYLRRKKRKNQNNLLYLNIKYLQSLFLRFMRNGFLIILIFSSCLFNGNSQIIYTDCVPDIVVYSDGTTVWEEILLDMNNDSQLEMNIFLWDDDGEWFQGSIDLLPVLPNNETTADIISNIDCEALYLDSDDNISNASYFTNFNPCMVDGTGLLCIYESATQNTYGLWPGQENKFLGFRFRVGSDTLYGWVRMDVTADCDSITIKDYAWNSLPNQSILAGQTLLSSEELRSESEKIIYAENQIRIQSEFIGNFNLEIFSLEGKLIYRSIIRNNEIIDTHFLSSGIYLVKIQNEDKYLQLKFFK